MGVLTHPYLFFEILFLVPGLKPGTKLQQPTLSLPQSLPVEPGEPAGDKGESNNHPLKEDGYSLDNDLSFQKRIPAVSPWRTYGVYLFLSLFISGCLFLPLHLAQVQVSAFYSVLRLFA